VLPRAMQARDVQDYTHVLSRSAPSRRGSFRSALCRRSKIVVSAARIRGLLVHPAELAGKQAASERAPHEQADLFGLQQGNDFPFEIAAGDRVISLKRVESGQVPELGEAERFGDLPCLPVGAADVADLPLLDQGVESAKRLFDRRHGIVAMDLAARRSGRGRGQGVARDRLQYAAPVHRGRAAALRWW
jgi:hypothetical protein